MSEQNEVVPPLNLAIEDYLAHGGDEIEHSMMLYAWLMLGAEYLARASGRGRARDALHSIDSWLRTAQPVRAWKP